MIYSQVISNEQFNPALALFKTAGLIRTTAGIQQTQATSDDSRNLSRSSERSHVTYVKELNIIICQSNSMIGRVDVNDADKQNLLKLKEERLVDDAEWNSSDAKQQ
ncbi:unnamed protein product [Acanthocheilonema viteae]|uniref:Uncharacterized protein n=1 Tax=Acanthocheilonema viteae TaxID=6277 RepID=A0A498SJ78_ACAVI|nr:unnamed protein product [Acanthocheilonema viteae]